MTESEKKEFERLQSLADALDKHPATIQQRRKEAADILEKRKAAAARIEDLNLDIEALGVIQREIDALVQTLADIDKKRENVQIQISQKRGFLMREKTGIEGEIKQNEAILLRTHDAAIDEALAFFRERWERLLVKKINTQERHGATNIFTEKKEITIYSNRDSIKDALSYCRAAIDELEKIKLRPDIDMNRIKTLKSGIPDADELRETVSEKNMERREPGPGLISAIREATGNQIDYEISRLKEKADKLLAPRRATR